MSTNSPETPQQSHRLDNSHEDIDDFNRSSDSVRNSDNADSNSNQEAYLELADDGSIPVISKRGLRMCHLNVNSLPNKLEDLRYLLRNSPFDIIGLTETHCDNTVSDNELHIDGYDLLRKDRSRHGGGVMIYLKNTLHFQHVKDLGLNLETIWIKTKVRNVKSFLICVMYRPPNSSVDYFDLMSAMMSNALDFDCELIILGDLNCDLLSDNVDSSTRSLMTVMQGSLLSQLIEIPTRVTQHSKTLIDHIYTTCPDDHSISGVIKTHISDHFLIFTCLHSRSAGNVHNDIKFRNLKEFKQENFVNDLFNLMFRELACVSNVDTAWKLWYNQVMSVINKHMPYKRKRMRKKPSPWITGEIITLINKRKYLHNKALKFNSSGLWKEYRRIRNMVTSLTKKSKQKYIQGLLQDKSGDPGALWSILKQLSSSTGQLSIKLNINDVEIYQPEIVAEKLNDYFIDSVSELLGKTDWRASETTSPHVIVSCPLPQENCEDLDHVDRQIFDIPSITYDFVVKEIDSHSVKKATGPDDISVKMLKMMKYATNVIDGLIYMSKGHFPKAWCLFIFSTFLCQKGRSFPKAWCLAYKIRPHHTQQTHFLRAP